MTSLKKSIITVIASLTILPIGCHPVNAEDCKYEQNVQLSEDGAILSAESQYECKQSKDIVVLDPTLETVVIKKRYRPPVVSTSDYRNHILGNNNSKGLDFLINVFYNVN